MIALQTSCSNAPSRCLLLVLHCQQSRRRRDLPAQPAAAIVLIAVKPAAAVQQWHADFILDGCPTRPLSSKHATARPWQACRRLASSDQPQWRPRFRMVSPRLAGSAARGWHLQGQAAFAPWPRACGLAPRPAANAAARTQPPARPCARCRQPRPRGSAPRGRHARKPQHDSEPAAGDGGNSSAASASPNPAAAAPPCPSDWARAKSVGPCARPRAGSSQCQETGRRPPRLLPRGATGGPRSDPETASHAAGAYGPRLAARRRPVPTARSSPRRHLQPHAGSPRANGQAALRDRARASLRPPPAIGPHDGGDGNRPSPCRTKVQAPFIRLIIRIFQFVFLTGTIFFSHKKSVNSIFQPAYQHSRMRP
jgi:hypothetical protein